MSLPPLSALHAWRLVYSAAPARVARPEAARLDDELRRRIEAWTRAYPFAEDWRLLGAFLQRGETSRLGETLGPSILGSSSLGALMAEAHEWRWLGGRAAGERNPPNGKLRSVREILATMPPLR